ncbi:MAG: hypothetical protein FD155_3401 [Bacteroidetes bacterium]|nr:MAG: hypothetical protein FD155_3401 [Bacteroidota bacterium]
MNDPMLKNKTMPATFILTSAKISYINLSLFYKLLVMSCLEIIGVEGNSEIPAIWRIYNRES